MPDPEGRQTHEEKLRFAYRDGALDVLTRLGTRGIISSALHVELSAQSYPETRKLLNEILAALERLGAIRSEVTSSGGWGQGRPGTRWFIADKDAL